MELLPGKVQDSSITVTFYEGYGPYANKFKESELTLDAYGKVAIQDGDIPKESFPWNGYEKSNYMPKTYADYDGKHEVEPDFWYIENGEFKLFDDTVVLTEDTDVYWLYKELSVNAFGSAIVVRYDENSRLQDSIKAFLDKAIAQIKAAKKTNLPIYKELNQMVLGMFKNYDLTEDDYINEINVAINFVDALKKTDSQSINNAINGEGVFEVTKGNLDIFKAIHDELKTITFDAILDVESNSAMNSMVNLVGYDVCKNIFDSKREDYCNVLSYIITEAEDIADISVTIPAELIAAFNPIADIYVPLFDEAEEKAISEFDESICYNENPYLQYLIEELDIFQELFSKDSTGYKLNDIIAYFEYMVKLLIAADDAIYWYDDTLGVDIDSIYDTIFIEAYSVNSKIDEVLNDTNHLDNLPNKVIKALEGLQEINNIFLNVKQFFKNDINIQAEIQELISSGELHSKIDEFKESPAGQNIGAEFIDDFVKLLEDIAENGGSDYKVPTTDITTIDKYEVEIGDYTFTTSRYFVF